MAEWRTMPFSDAVVVNPPVHLKRGGTYPFVAMADVEPTRRSIHSLREREFRGSGARFEDGDTLMARITPCLENGKIGRYQSARASSVAHGSTEFIVIRGRGGITGDEFAYYLTQSKGVRDYAISQMSGTSGRQRVPTQSLDHLHVRVPGLAQQFAIAQTLGTLDDKIELNSRMNGTLESMARAVFKDWFVDFGPTRAKAGGREPYLAPELWGLFPDALDDEGKPTGWKLGTLADISDSPRRSISPADVAEETPYIGLQHMPRRSIALSEWEGASKVKSGKSAFRKGEFLFGKLRPYFHKAGFAPMDGICSTDIVVVTPRTSDWAAFTLACLSSDEFVNYTDQTSTGTKMPRTSWKTMGQYEICLPPEQVARAFQSLVQPLIDRVSANINESRTLAQTRDLLLPKLMSGEIRLGKAEKVREAVI